MIFTKYLENYNLNIFYRMSDNEQPPPPKKAPKKKREMTEEQKEKLREQLKRGRATALANRQKRMLIRKAEEKAEREAQDEKLAKALLGEQPQKEEIKELKEQVKSLKADKGEDHKEEIAELRKQIKMITELMKGFNDKYAQAKSAEPKNEVVRPEPAPVQKEPEPKPEPKPEPLPEPVQQPPPTVMNVRKIDRRADLRGFF